MWEATINADGFGFGWLDPAGQTNIYTSTQPIWSESNLAGLSQSLFSHYWLANVRSATPPLQTTQANTQPFRVDHLLFTHNGHIKNFNTNIREKFHDLLKASIQTDIQGNTDSEYIFALLRQQLSETGGIAGGFSSMVNILTEITGQQETLLNLIIGDGKKLHILRHAINGDCPSLYFNTADDNFPGGVLVASEALTKSVNWQTVPENSYATISIDTTPIFTPL